MERRQEAAILDFAAALADWTAAMTISVCEDVLICVNCHRFMAEANLEGTGLHNPNR